RAPNRSRRANNYAPHARLHCYDETPFPDSGQTGRRPFGAEATPLTASRKTPTPTPILSQCGHFGPCRPPARTIAFGCGADFTSRTIGQGNARTVRVGRLRSRNDETDDRCA